MATAPTSSMISRLIKKINHYILDPFTCNICGKMNVVLKKSLQRENPTCSSCGSTVRMRSIIHVLSSILFGKSLLIDHFPIRKDIRVVGLSDWLEYAKRLENKLDYTNTFYHQAPQLDIMQIDKSLESSLDAIISSDVFEHVEPPAEKAFVNSLKLLKKGGSLLLTVPYSLEEETLEHFPNLFQYEIREEITGRKVLENITRQNDRQIYENLVYHGGDGETLEFRVFSKLGLIQQLNHAGFTNIKFYDKPVYKFGIVWQDEWSLPISAEKPY